MFKKIFFASLLILSTQNVMAFGLSDVNNAANQATRVTDTAQKAMDKTEQATDKVKQVNEKSVSDMAKTVVTDSAKEGVNGAVDGVVTGDVVKGGAAGAVSGAKTSVNKLMN
ncbi:MAG: hypothetical protein K9L22_06355 [Methylococcaceae bacterium]|nr:hypothetical protein [Methylococcaceae bacterium]